MTRDEAKQRIRSSIEQFGVHAGAALDLIISEVRSDLGYEAANDLIDEFDLELEYNIVPTESDGGSS